MYIFFAGFSDALRRNYARQADLSHIELSGIPRIAFAR